MYEAASFFDDLLWFTFRVVVVSDSLYQLSRPAVFPMNLQAALLFIYFLLELL